MPPVIRKKCRNFFQAEPFDTEKALVTLLESRGYQPVRYETHMVRDLSEPFPEAPMPPGLEIRPVKPEHVRPIFEASPMKPSAITGAAVDESEEEYQQPIGKSGFPSRTVESGLGRRPDGQRDPQLSSMR